MKALLWIKHLLDHVDPDVAWLQSLYSWKRKPPVREEVSEKPTQPPSNYRAGAKSVQAKNTQSDVRKMWQKKIVPVNLARSDASKITFLEQDYGPSLCMLLLSRYWTHSKAGLTPTDLQTSKCMLFVFRFQQALHLTLTYAVQILISVY